MEFALKTVGGKNGVVLCDAKTGEVVKGQSKVTIETEISGSIAKVYLTFLNLPIFKE